MFTDKHEGSMAESSSEVTPELPQVPLLETSEQLQLSLFSSWENSSTRMADMVCLQSVGW